MENLFCKIYILASLSKQALFEMLIELTEGHPVGGAIEMPWGIIDLLKNDEVDLTKISGSDGFLFFPYFLDIEVAPDVDREIYIKEIGSILVALWDKKVGAVAACDFETELPRKGGFCQS
jgi:hypothetical protein